MHEPAAVLGVFVGGQGRRMGGANKALLAAPDEPGQTLVGRLVGLGRALGLEVVLLGGVSLAEHVPGVLQLPDARSGIGPLAGLERLLAHAGARRAIAVACDLPYVTERLLERIRLETPEANLLAPRDAVTGKWQALCARYDGSLHSTLERALTDGERSFQGFFKRTTVTELSLSADEHALLHDWDSPADMR